MASRVTYTIEEGQTKITYGACSRTKGDCAYTKKIEKDSTLDLNQKQCLQNDVVTTQTCCPIENEKFGTWSAPGKSC